MSRNQYALSRLLQFPVLLLALLGTSSLEAQSYKANNLSPIYLGRQTSRTRQVDLCLRSTDDGSTRAHLTQGVLAIKRAVLSKCTSFLRMTSKRRWVWVLLFLVGIQVIRTWGLPIWRGPAPLEPLSLGLTGSQDNLITVAVSDCDLLESEWVSSRLSKTTIDADLLHWFPKKVHPFSTRVFPYDLKSFSYDLSLFPKKVALFPASTYRYLNFKVEEQCLTCPLAQLKSFSILRFLPVEWTYACSEMLRQERYRQYISQIHHLAS